MLRYVRLMPLLLALAACATQELPGAIRSDTATSARLFQNDPNSVSLIDVAAVFALAQSPNATPAQVVDIVNTLTNSNLTQLEPTPSLATADFVAPAGSIDFLDVAFVFALVQNPNATNDTLVSTINALTGQSISSDDLLVTLGPSPSPTTPPPTGTTTLSVPQTLSGSLATGDSLEAFDTDPAFTRFVDTYTLVGVSAGQGIEITMVSANYIPDVELFDLATGDVIVRSSSGNDPTTTSLTAFLQSGITYGVRVSSTSFNVPEPLSGSYTLSTDLISTGTSGFQIEVEFLNTSAGIVPADIQTLVSQAATRWQQLIIDDLPDAFVSLDPGQCNIPANGNALSDRPVDDLLILVRLDTSIGGAATAGPCRNRGAGTPAVAGQVNINPTLLTEDETTIRDVITHEIGHILGIGAGGQRWVNGITGSGTNDPRLTTPNAVSQYQALGGTATSIPVQVGVEGHWRGDVAGETIDQELMTPIYQVGEANPLSRITLGFLSDMSYGVDLNAADPFTVPDRSYQHGIERSGTFIDLSNDYLPIPDNATDGVQLR